MFKLKIYLFILFLTPSIIFTQNTVGVLYNSPNSFNGYTLITKDFSTYLINNCGEVINQWISSYEPGNSVYLLEDGSLLRACKTGNTDITFGGTGGRIEKHDWDGNLVWEYDYSSAIVIQHHDIYPMANGNVLMLAVSTISNAAAIQAGRNPNNLVDGILYNEQILELQPSGTNSANVVWEWNVMDHLIQEYDNTKDNFGSISENPQLLDINFLGSSAGKNNWLHFNSIQYDKTLDQIVISSRLLSEIYIIDHSTTTIESGSHSGGVYGKGGDILYRWGNPEAYAQGTVDDRILYGQHYPHFIPDGMPNAGKMIVFNNGFGRTPSFSEIMIFTPPTSGAGVYDYTLNTSYGPSTLDYIYIDPIDETNFFSRFLSGAQQLPNGNILICSGANGNVFELDSNKDKVWKYILPVGSAGIMTQGDDPFESGNTLFRAIRYPTDYSAFIGKDVSPGNPIELNPDLSGCNLLSTNNETSPMVTLYPNPVIDDLNIDTQNPISRIEIYSILGSIIKTELNSNQIDLKSLERGMYVAKIFSNSEVLSKRIFKQ